MPETSIKEALLQKQFINASIELAEIQMSETLTNAEKQLKMNIVWKGFKRFVYENFTEK